jgi:hypothetical protein
MYYPTILIYVCSDSAPNPASEKIRIRSRIHVIFTSFHIRQKNIDVDVIKVLSNPIRFHL